MYVINEQLISSTRERNLDDQKYKITRPTRDGIL